MNEGMSLVSASNCNGNPLTTQLRRISLANVALLLSAKGPNFVNLQIPGAKVLHSGIHQSSAAFTSNKQQAHDRIAVESGEPFGRADRAALKQAMQSTLCCVRVRQEHIAGEFGVGFGKAGIARSAFPALDSALTEVTEFLADLVLASDAGHWNSPLCLSGMTCYHEIASEVRVTPRFGLSGIHGSNRRYRVCFYCYGGRISCLLFVIGPWILCLFAPTNHGPFANLPAKSFLPQSRRNGRLPRSPLHMINGVGSAQESRSILGNNSAHEHPLTKNIPGRYRMPHPLIRISAIDISHGSNFTLLVKSGDDSMNRSQKVSPSARVAHVFHVFSNVVCGHIFARRSERHADRVGQPQSIFLNKFGFAAQDLQGGDSLSEFNDGLLGFSGGILRLAQNRNLFREVEFGLFQSQLVSVGSHIG
jgi:hypothetical protein